MPGRVPRLRSRRIALHHTCLEARILGSNFFSRGDVIDGVDQYLDEAVLDPRSVLTACGGGEGEAVADAVAVAAGSVPVGVDGKLVGLADANVGARVEELGGAVGGMCQAVVDRKIGKEDLHVAVIGVGSRHGGAVGVVACGETDRCDLCNDEESGGDADERCGAKLYA